MWSERQALLLTLSMKVNLPGLDVLYPTLSATLPLGLPFSSEATGTRVIGQKHLEFRQREKGFD